MAIKSKIGCIHNFGRQVLKIDEDGVVSFHKPRPISNELFLFGVNSPLKQILANANDAKSKVSWSAIFALHGKYSDNKDDWCTHCGSISNVESIDCNHLHRLISENADFRDFLFYQFGGLMAYCQFWGVTDVTIENVVVSKKGIHVIDAESSFNLVRFISETNCIGADNIAKCLSAFIVMLRISKKYDENTVLKLSDYYLKNSYLELILTGYLEILDVMIEKRNELKSTVEKFLKEISNVPLRVILRNSFDYLKKNDRGNPFLPEEKIQMERGDVPYFFSTYADQRVFYIAEKSGQRKTVNFDKSHPLFLMQSHQRRYDIEAIFDYNRLNEIRAAGAIEIFRDLREEHSDVRNLNIGSTALVADGKAVSYKFGEFLYSGKDRTNDDYNEKMTLNRTIDRVE